MSIYFCSKCDCLRDSDYDPPEIIHGQEVCEMRQEIVDDIPEAWQYEFDAKQDYFCEKGEVK